MKEGDSIVDPPGLQVTCRVRGGSCFPSRTLSRAAPHQGVVQPRAKGVYRQQPPKSVQSHQLLTWPASETELSSVASSGLLGGKQGRHANAIDASQASR